MREAGCVPSRHRHPGLYAIPGPEGVGSFVRVAPFLWLLRVPRAYSVVWALVSFGAISRSLGL